MNTDNLIRPSTYARAKNISTNTIFQWIRNGNIKAVKIDDVLFLDKNDVATGFKKAGRPKKTAADIAAKKGKAKVEKKLKQQKKVVGAANKKPNLKTLKPKGKYQFTKGEIVPVIKSGDGEYEVKPEINSQPQNKNPEKEQKKFSLSEELKKL